MIRLKAASVTLTAHGDPCHLDKMPCKGDELCCDESNKQHTDFENQLKTIENEDVLAEETSSSHEQPIQQQQKPLSNGSLHEAPKQNSVAFYSHFLTLFVV